MEAQLRALPYRELQQLAKQRNLRANRKREELIDSVLKAIRDNGETEESLGLMQRRIDPRRAPPQPRHHHRLRESRRVLPYASVARTTYNYSNSTQSMNASLPTNIGNVGDPIFNDVTSESFSRYHYASTPMITHQTYNYYNCPTTYQKYSNSPYRQPPTAFQPDDPGRCYPGSSYNTNRALQYTPANRFNEFNSPHVSTEPARPVVVPQKPKKSLDHKYLWADAENDNSLFCKDSKFFDELFASNGIDEFFKTAKTDKLDDIFNLR